MNIKHLVILSLLILLISCNDEKIVKQTQPIEDISPEILVNSKSESTSSFSFSKRSYKESVIVELFEEAIDKNEDLRILVGQIRVLQAAKWDSTREMSAFIENNDNFYEEADDYLFDNIEDTILREQTRLLFKEAQISFHSKISSEEKLLETVRERSKLLEQQLDLMKVFVAHSMMKNYQKDNLPDTKPLEDLIQQYDVLIKETKQYAN